MSPAPDDSTPITTRDMVTRLLGQTMQWWYRHGKALQATTAFPAPLPGFGKRKWDPAAVAAWKRSRMPLELREPPPPADQAATLAAVLDARAAAIARGAR